MLPIPIQTAYAELLQRFDARPPLSIDGSITRIQKAGNFYWVARKRLGDKVVEDSIGPDTEETRARVEQAKKEQAVYAAWSEKNASLVAMLKAAGALTLDQSTGKILSSLSRVGFFQAGGLLGGTNAFRLFPLFLGVAAPASDLAMTGDVDMIAPSHITLAGPHEALSHRLKLVGLDAETRFGMSADTPPKLVVGDNVEIEILSPMSRSGMGSHFHEGLKERVTALRYLEFSLKDPVRHVALYRNGIEVMTPSPERFALHKLIVAQLRQGPFAIKRQKDLSQASWLLDVLVETRPYETWVAYSDLLKRGKRWVYHLEKSLMMAEPAKSALERLSQEYSGPGLDDSFSI